MALTDKAQKLYAVAGGKAKEVKDGLTNPHKRAAYMEAGRTAISQGTALVTDKAATARVLAGQGWSRTTRLVEDVMTPPPAWDTDSKKAKLYAATDKGVELVQKHGPKVTEPVLRLSRKAAKASKDKTPVAKSFASRNRDEILLVLAVAEVIVCSRRIIQRKRRSHKK